MRVDFDYYCNQFARGREPTIPEASFSHYSSAAEDEMRYATGNLLESDDERQEIKRCVCELAEFLCQADQAHQTAARAGGAGIMTSYSNDGESASFQASDSEFTASGQRKKITGIIRKHLLWTGLLSRRCARYES
ncbi:MAG: hypothetical protein IJ468_14905 [Lachnospiraceae bacterium]|nr:hypothetical protein [Lachnospiraceae bacterium]